MKLTKAQRHSYYKKALTTFNERDDGGALCLILNYIIGWEDYSMKEVRDMLPELKKKKPRSIKYKDGLWWPSTKEGNLKRRACLKACIRETAPKRKKK